MAAPKKTPPAAGPATVLAGSLAEASAELVIMVALEPIKHDGQEVEPGGQFLVKPDDVAGLVEAKLAEAADVIEAEQS